MQALAGERLLTKNRVNLATITIYCKPIHDCGDQSLRSLATGLYR